MGDNGIAIEEGKKGRGLWKSEREGRDLEK